MGFKKFTEFTTQSQLLSTDFLVGFKSDLSEEYRATVGQVVRLATSQTQELFNAALEQLDQENLGLFSDVTALPFGDFYGLENALQFTRSAQVSDVAYNGVSFTPGSLSLRFGRNHDIDLNNAGFPVAIRGGNTNSISAIEGVGNNDVILGSESNIVFFSPELSGTYYLTDVNDTSKFIEINIGNN